MTDTSWLPLLISDVLSVITIALCFFLKLPQIKRLYDRKNVIGLNLYSLVFEICSYSIMASYNYVKNHALLSYFEYPVIIIQQWILIYFFLKYSSRLNTKAAFIFAGYLVSILCICKGLIPVLILNIAVVMCTPVSLSSKVIQLWEIWKIKRADSISLVTWALSAFTNFARIYTVYLDSADALLMTNVTISGSLSLSILVSAYYLQKSKRK